RCGRRLLLHAARRRDAHRAHEVRRRRLDPVGQRRRCGHAVAPARTHRRGAPPDPRGRNPASLPFGRGREPVRLHHLARGPRALGGRLDRGDHRRPPPPIPPPPPPPPPTHPRRVLAPLETTPGEDSRRAEGPPPPPKAPAPAA